jgi:hypothetical protein
MSKTVVLLIVGGLQTPYRSGLTSHLMVLVQAAVPIIGQRAMGRS